MVVRRAMCVSIAVVLGAFAALAVRPADDDWEAPLASVAGEGVKAGSGTTKPV